jgi:hypothetical protein
MSTLHVTNGDSAVEGIRRAGVQGEVLAWRDVLHEGPVPAGLDAGTLREVRALFIAQRGWGDFRSVLRDLAARDRVLARAAEREEVVLWFEHDLYDQLQLVQVLAVLAEQGRRPAKLTLACEAEYLGEASAGRLLELHAGRRPVTDDQLALATRAWEAFRSPDVEGLRALIEAGTSALPFLAPALERHLEEFPSEPGSLSRSERQALEAVAGGAETAGAAFPKAHHEREPAVFLGDIVFAWYLERLSDVHEPLLLLGSGERVRAPRLDESAPAFWKQTLALTDTGRAVLAGTADHAELNGMDRWLGGVHIVRRPQP